MKLVNYVNKHIKPQEAYRLAFGYYPENGKCYCPFHDNRRTPAAKIYDYGLRCFGVCNRVYTSYDILKGFRPDILDKLASRVLEDVHVGMYKRGRSEGFECVSRVRDEVLSSILSYFRA